MKKVINEKSDPDARLKLYKKKMESLMEEFEIISSKHNTDKNKAIIFLLEIKKKHKIVEKEKKNLKKVFKKLAKEQRIYYNDLIKKGIDVRSNLNLILEAME